MMVQQTGADGQWAKSVGRAEQYRSAVPQCAATYL